MFKIFYSQQETNNDNGKLPFAPCQLIITLIGLAASFWTYLLHIQLKAQAGSPLICDVSETINCSKIIGSSQGELFGLPLGIWGMMFWLVAIGLVFFPYFSKASRGYIVFWRLFVATTGFVFALGLIYISYFILKGICEFCSVVQASCIIYFIIAFVSYRKHARSSSVVAGPVDFIKLASMTIVSFIIPLLIFVGTHSFFYNHYQKTAPKKVTQGEIAGSIQAPFLPLLDDQQVDYSLGEQGSPVEIIEFTDFECPYCQKFHQVIDEIKPLIKKGMVVVYFRNWPLKYHRYATKLALAARCAGEQGKFWQFANWAFESTHKYAHNPSKKQKALSDTGIKSKATLLGLDIKQFDSCFKSSRTSKKLEKDKADAQQLGGNGTPFILINGAPYKGNWLKPGQLKADVTRILKSQGYIE